MVVATRMAEDRAEDIRVAALGAVPPVPTVPGRRPTAHWKCADCLAPCGCSGDARLLPHARCGLAR